MPTIDWNWFFSSVAQSAAAIVGLFGGFIVTKILTNQTAFAEKNRRIQELIILGQKLTEASSRLSFTWYHRYTIQDVFEKLEALLEDDDDQTPDDLYDKLNFSPYIARAEAIDKIIRAKLLRKKRIEKEEEERLRREQVNSTRGISAYSIERIGAAPLGIKPSLTLQPALNKEREEIDALYSEAKHHARLVSDFHALVVPHPESSLIITASLTLIYTLFFVGVIYPLSFLPMATNIQPSPLLSEIPAFLSSFRGILLMGVSLFFTVMLAIFFVMNICLKYSKTQLEKLERYTHLAEYSQYFANREENVAYRNRLNANTSVKAD